MRSPHAVDAAVRQRDREPVVGEGRLPHADDMAKVTGDARRHG
jgi:hypothetical protein